VFSVVVGSAPSEFRKLFRFSFFFSPRGVANTELRIEHESRLRIPGTFKAHSKKIRYRLSSSQVLEIRRNSMNDFWWSSLDSPDKNLKF
jgi:hypothetical protein